MRNLSGPLYGWLGLVDAFGVGLALVGWLLLRGRGPRARLLATAFGGALLAGAFATVIGRAATVGSGLALNGFDEEGGRRLFDILLALAGVGAGVAAALAVRARVVGYVTAVPAPYDALAEEPVGETEVIDDSLDTAPDDDDPLYTAPGDEVGWALAPWLDLLVVAVALALPTIGIGGRFGGFGESRGDVTVLVVCVHLLTGLIAGGALYVALHTDDADERWPVLAFALVAAGTGLSWAFPHTFSNEFWFMFSTGLALGLVAVSALPLIVRVLTGDRRALAIGVVGAAALVVLSAVVSTRVEVGRFEGGGFDLGGQITPVPQESRLVVFPSDFPSDFPTEFPSFPTEFPTFPTFPPFPTP